MQYTDADHWREKRSSAEHMAQVYQNIEKVVSGILDEYDLGEGDLSVSYEKLHDFYKFAFEWLIDKRLNSGNSSENINEDIAEIVSEWKKHEGD